jgi:hypothetical protein
VIHTLIIDFFSHGLRSVKIEQELEKFTFQHHFFFFFFFFSSYVMFCVIIKKQILITDFIALIAVNNLLDIQFLPSC